VRNQLGALSTVGAVSLRHPNYRPLSPCGCRPQRAKRRQLKSTGRNINQDAGKKPLITAARG